MAIRVLHVVTHMNRGGLESMIMNYYRNINREIVQFDFLTHRTNRCHFDDEIESLGGIIYHLPALNPFSIRYRRALKDFFKNHPEYEIIHVHQDCMSSIILKEAKKQNVPVRIAHSHNSNQDKNLKYVVKLYYRRLISKYATKLFACGVKAGQWMFCCSDFIVLNNAIDAKQYTFSDRKSIDIRNKIGIEKSALVIGHVGRFSAVKNHEKLVDIFAEIRKKRNAILLLVGDGEQRGKIESKINGLGLNDYVIFTGIRSDVADLLQAMDVFVFPSLYEGLPVTIIEAQAAGLPCVISDRVPIECKKTDLVQFLPLDSSMDLWVDTIIKTEGAERKDYYEEIKKSGFDIRENAKWLEQFYLGEIKKYEQTNSYSDHTNI